MPHAAHPWLLSKHRPDVQILRLCLGRVQYSLLFLEIIGDLLEKQEALGLVGCILTFLFLLLSFFHLRQAQVVWRLLPRSRPALQASPRQSLPRLPSSLLFPFLFCSLPPQSQGLLQSRWGNHGNKMMAVKVDCPSIGCGVPEAASLCPSPRSGSPPVYCGWTGNRAASLCDQCSCCPSPVTSPSREALHLRLVRQDLEGLSDRTL